MKKFWFLILAAFIVICFGSCKKNKDDVIVFDQTHPLSLAPDVEWALVTDPYATYRKEIDWNAEITGHCRRGEILQVFAKSIDKEKNIWYKFENGWLPQNCLSIYTNRYKAQTAAENLKD